MIGDLRHLLTLQEEIRTPDGGGGFTVAWQNIAQSPKIYASITSLSGNEQLSQQQLATIVSCRMIIRFRDDITARMRLTDGKRFFNILSVKDADGTGIYLDIIAEVRE